MGGWGVRGGCERRSYVMVKIKKKSGWGDGVGRIRLGVRVDVKAELK